jgi:hypothetical protein
MSDTHDTARALVLDYLSFHDFSDSYARFRVESLTHLPQVVTARTDEGKQEEEEAIKVRTRLLISTEREEERCRCDARFPQRIGNQWKIFPHFSTYFLHLFMCLCVYSFVYRMI